MIRTSCCIFKKYKGKNHLSIDNCPQNSIREQKVNDKKAVIHQVKLKFDSNNKKN